MVAGSGILSALGIRESKDIDLLVSDEAFEIIIDRGWKAETLEDGTMKLANGVFDCVWDWYGKSFEEMISRAEYIEGLAYMSLDDVYKWKQALGREKDMIDLRSIERYLIRKSE